MTYQIDDSVLFVDDILTFCRVFQVQRGLDSIRPLFDLLGNDHWIAGSYAAFCLAQTDTPMLPNDLDIFSRSSLDAGALAGRIALIYSTVPTFNGVAWNFDKPIHGLSVQIISPSPHWSSFPDDLLNSFDFDISRAVIMTPTWGLADQNVGLKEAKILKLHDPLRTMKRVSKYQARGITFTDHELLKLFRAWDALDPEKKKTQISEAYDALVPAVAVVDSDGWEFDEEDDYFDGED